MAEIGLAASVIELINTGFMLGKFLNDTYSDYRNAPREVLEIASEISICCELMEPLGEKLMAGSVGYTKNFETSVRALVKNSNDTFDKIRELVPSNKDGNLDRGIRPKWTYVLNKGKIAKHRQRIGEIRVLFIFIKEAMKEANPQASAASTAGCVQDLSTSKEPITLSGAGRDSSGAPMTVYATISWQRPISSRGDEIRSGLAVARLSKPADYLRILRQNPDFSADLMRSQSADETRGYTRSVQSRDAAVDRIVARERKRELRMMSERAKKQAEDDAEHRQKKTADKIAKESESASLDQDLDLDLPDDREATEDVNDLVSSWFGSNTSNPRAHRPSLAVTDTTRGTDDGSKSPSRSPRDPQSPRTASPGGQYVAEQIKYRCNICDQRIRGTRFECQSCTSYDMCRECFDRERLVGNWIHRHPQSQFRRGS